MPPVELSQSVLAYVGYFKAIEKFGLEINPKVLALFKGFFAKRLQCYIENKEILKDPVFLTDQSNFLNFFTKIKKIFFIILTID